MRAIGISTINATRASKGCTSCRCRWQPLAYYGVGDFYVNTGSRRELGGELHRAVHGVGTPLNAWKTERPPTRRPARTTSSRSGRTEHPGHGHDDQRHRGVVQREVSAAASACKVKAELSWNGSTGGTVRRRRATSRLETPLHARYLQRSLAWDTGHTWVANDFTNANIDVRLTYLKARAAGPLAQHARRDRLLERHPEGQCQGSGNTFSRALGRGAPSSRGRERAERRRYAPENNGGSPYSGPNTLYNGSATNEAAICTHQAPGRRDGERLRSRILRHGGNPSVPATSVPVTTGSARRARQSQPITRSGTRTGCLGLTHRVGEPRPIRRQSVRRPDRLRPGERLQPRRGNLRLRCLPQRLVHAPHRNPGGWNVRPPGVDDQANRRLEEQRHECREHVRDRGDRGADASGNSPAIYGKARWPCTTTCSLAIVPALLSRQDRPERGCGKPR